jgi:hypothetical protein
MLVMRSNPKGGRPLKKGHFPLHFDEDGNFGHLLGYNEKGNKLILPIPLTDDFVQSITHERVKYDYLIKEINKAPKEPLKIRLTRWLLAFIFGKKLGYRIWNQVEQEEVD